MQIEIISPDKKIYSGKINLVQVPGSKGSFEVLNNHAPIVSTLEKGTIRLVPEHEPEEFFEIEGGIIEVKKNKIIVLVESMMM
ncbi:MAG: ATP synthase F1 subunit epsilon [Bacteroidetes bacterium]|nr:ATP synthase F1 subunit epsilon [Bacteroidota bacterium]